MSANDRTLERIAGLLSMAEGTYNTAEREAFMQKAQTLATIHSIDMARARQHTRSKEDSVPIQRTVKVGERREQGRLIRIDLLLGIARANDIQCTISYHNTHVYLHGYEEDINTTEALYASLVVQMSSAAEHFLDEGSCKNETVYRKKRVKVEGYWSNGRDGYEEQWGYFPIPKQTARSEFQSAFAGQIENRLFVAKREAEAKIIQEEKERKSRPHLDEFGSLSTEFKVWFEVNQGHKFGEDRDFDAELEDILTDHTNDWVLDYSDYLAQQADSEPGTELVLVKKHEEIQDFYKKKNPHLFKGRRGRGYSGHQSSAHSDSARSAGREAGRSARIGGQGSIGGQRKAIGG